MVRLPLYPEIIKMQTPIDACGALRQKQMASIYRNYPYQIICRNIKLSIYALIFHAKLVICDKFRLQ